MPNSLLRADWIARPVPRSSNTCGSWASIWSSWRLTAMAASGAHGWAA